MSKSSISKRLALFLWICTPIFSYAADQSSCLTGGFLPDNKMRIPVNAPFAGEMTEDEFNAILDQVEKVYSPIIRAKGGKLQIQRSWTDETVNAYADRDGQGNWIVKMYGGLARHPSVTNDAFSLIACHEVGHHLGGAPKYAGRWAATEGQSDYFATLKCLRKVWENDNNSEIVSRIAVNSDVKSACENSFTDENSISICIRSAYAGLSSATVFASGKSISFNTPDPSVVNQTDVAHPKAQCRLDTYYNGGICQVPWGDELSDTDPTKGSCSTENGAKFGFRPLCWYKPTRPVPTPTPTPTPTSEPTPDPTPTLTPDPTVPCSDCTLYQGSLMRSRRFEIQPNRSYYYSESGTHSGWLSGPENANFDLYLLKWTGRYWSVVQSARGPSSSEFLSYTGTAGYYEWVVYSSNGSGDYQLGLSIP